MKITPLDGWIRAKTGAADAESLREYQIGKFCETLDYAKTRSRFYRDYLAKINIDQITSLDNISAIPYTTAEMLSEDPLGFVCVPPGDINRIVTLPTSGTTGAPKRIFFTSEDQELTVDFFHQGMSALADNNDRVMIFLPGETEGGVGDLLRRGLERLGCEGVIYGPIMDYCDAIRELSTGEYACAVGLPAQLLALSRLDGGIKLKSVLLCSDYVAEAIVHALENAWGCDVFGHYGMIETGLGGGVECSACAGYHMREADLLFEVIDPVTGLPAPDGERGELVFTTLTRRGMPLIRYRTGDVSRVITDRCLCGSALRRFERASGRICDIIEISGDCSLSMPMLDEILFCIAGLIGFTAEVAHSGGREKLALIIYAKDGAKAVGEAMERIKGDAHIGAALDSGLIKLIVLQGGAEVLTYGNKKRRVAGANRLYSE